MKVSVDLVGAKYYVITGITKGGLELLMSGRSIKQQLFHLLIYIKWFACLSQEPWKKLDKKGSKQWMLLKVLWIVLKDFLLIIALKQDKGFLWLSNQTEIENDGSPYKTVNVLNAYHKII